LYALETRPSVSVKKLPGGLSPRARRYAFVGHRR
jgi:hypothetical protein